MRPWSAAESMRAVDAAKRQQCEDCTHRPTCRLFGRSMLDQCPTEWHVEVIDGLTRVICSLRCT